MIITKEHQILSALYNLRCLNFNQFYALCFNGCSERSCTNQLSKMVSAKLISKSGYHRDTAYYMLCKKGIDYLREKGVVPLDCNKQGIIYADSILSAGKVALKPQIAAHQLALNQFVMDFMNCYPDIVFDYYDEKYISKIFSQIRPDGIIKTSHCLYFLEMDMNTEREARLLQKWESYHAFLSSSEYYENKLPIKVLFILGNISDKSGRKYALREYIDRNLRGEISDEFNLFVGIPEDLLKIFSSEESPLPKIFRKKGFSVKEKGRLSDDLPEFDYVITHDALSFAVIDYTDESMLDYKNIVFYPKYSALYNENLRYLVVAKSEAEAYRLQQQTLNSSGIYFSTVKRLNDYTFPSALFQFGDKTLYHFGDAEFLIKKQEAYIQTLFQ